MENIPEFLEPCVLKGFSLLYLKCPGKKCGHLMSLAISQDSGAQCLHSQHSKLAVHKNFMSFSSKKYWKLQVFFLKNVQLIFPQFSPLSV